MTSKGARAYFERCGLTYGDVSENAVVALVLSLDREIGRAARCGECFESMRLSDRIDVRRKPDGSLLSCFICVDAEYFEGRECISFNHDGFIGFCGWASSANEKPIIKAFIEWCDLLRGGGVDG